MVACSEARAVGRTKEFPDEMSDLAKLDRLAKTPIFRRAVSLDRSKKCGGMVRIDGDRQ